MFLKDNNESFKPWLRNKRWKRATSRETVGVGEREGVRKEGKCAWALCVVNK